MPRDDIDRQRDRLARADALDHAVQSIEAAFQRLERDRTGCRALAFRRPAPSRASIA
jgi:hypothetical protein